MIRGYRNYKELILRLAKTDFKLRYQGSALGYFWAILKPLLMFTVLNFVFSSIFNFKKLDTPYYALELLTALLMFQFFSEGTISGMKSLFEKRELVTKIYIPRWTIIVASTLNSFFIFCMNLLVLAVFFVIYGKIPSITGILMYVAYAIILYVLVVSFSLLASTFFVRFRDLGIIWEVLLSVLMYASPVVYPLSILPAHLHSLLLINPLAFIIHYAKQGLVSGTFTSPDKFILLSIVVALVAFISYRIFKNQEKKVAEYV